MEIIKGLSVDEFERLKVTNPSILKRWGLLPEEAFSRPGACPDCGGPITYEGGCCVCYSCGYSECG